MSKGDGYSLAITKENFKLVKNKKTAFLAGFLIEKKSAQKNMRFEVKTSIWAPSQVNSV